MIAVVSEWTAEDIRQCESCQIKPVKVCEGGGKTIDSFVVYSPRGEIAYGPADEQACQSWTADHL